MKLSNMSFRFRTEGGAKQHLKVACKTSIIGIFSQWYRPRELDVSSAKGNENASWAVFIVLVSGRAEWDSVDNSRRFC